MKTLRMEFSKTDGDMMSISLPYVKDGLTAETVQAAMQVVIDNPIFVQTPTAIASAEIIDRTVTELIGA